MFFLLNTTSDYLMNFGIHTFHVCLFVRLFHMIFASSKMYVLTMVGLKYQKYRCIKIYEVLFNKKTGTQQRYYVVCFLCVKIWMMRCYLILSIYNYKTEGWFLYFVFIVNSSAFMTWYSLQTVRKQFLCIINDIF